MRLQWKPVTGFEGLYEVSENGDIKSIERNGTKGGILKQSVDRYGYKKVVLYKRNKPHYFTVHRIVASVFLGEPREKKTVNHIDTNKTNNHFKNLEWMTNIENLDHSFMSGLQKNPKQPIRVTDLETGIETVYASQKSAARSTGVHQRSIHHFLKQERIHHKFKFERV